MAGFGKPTGIKGIQEERQFTNPHVRFIRKRGRVIPIFNKKKIGQEISDIGETIATKGAIVAGATALAKKTKIGKSITKPISKFSFKTNMFNVKSGDGFKMKSAKRVTKFGLKGAKFGLKHSGKIGLAMLGAGIVSKLIGDEVQMRSPFGKDYFFRKDQHGRDS